MSLTLWLLRLVGLLPAVVFALERLTIAVPQVRLSRPVLAVPLALLLLWLSTRYRGFLSRRTRVRAVLMAQLTGIAATACAFAVIGVELGRKLDRLTVIVAIDRSRSIDLVPGAESRIQQEIQVAEQGMREGDRIGTLAGRALPMAEVALLDGEHELGRVQADERGEWVFVPTLPMAPGARALIAQAHNPDGGTVRSASPVIVVVPENAGGAALAMVPLPEGGARLMMAPGGDAESVTLDLVDRDNAGRLFMGGRAQPGALIHIYMDNKFLGRVQTDAEGGWRLAVKAVQGHTLRADMVEDKGKVLARLEVPLEPEPPMAQGGETVVVEQGASLWKIARRLYGSGPQSTVIYQPSKDRMRDPDRIYPGQVFQVPKK
ncbi:MAG: hypothetical protein H7Y60_06130 [Rhodospirillaceae bacterium]|nr:hypothetical protein [Rhodospirillales bacterium]